MLGWSGAMWPTCCHWLNTDMVNGRCPIVFVLTQSYPCDTWIICSTLRQLAVSNLGQLLFCLSVTWSRCRNACRNVWIKIIVKLSKQGRLNMKNAESRQFSPTPHLNYCCLRHVRSILNFHENPLIYLSAMWRNTYHHRWSITRATGMVDDSICVQQYTTYNSDGKLIFGLRCNSTYSNLWVSSNNPPRLNQNWQKMIFRYIYRIDRHRQTYFCLFVASWVWELSHQSLQWRHDGCDSVSNHQLHDDTCGFQLHTAAHHWNVISPCHLPNMYSLKFMRYHGFGTSLAPRT